MYTRRCRGDFVPHVELKPLSLSSCRYAPLSSPARRFHLSADDKTSRLPPDGPGGVSSGTPSPWQRPADYDELRAARKQSVNKHKQPLDVFMREWGLKGAMWVGRRLARVVPCRVVPCRVVRAGRRAGRKSVGDQRAGQTQSWLLRPSDADRTSRNWSVSQSSCHAPHSKGVGKLEPDGVPT